MHTELYWLLWAAKEAVFKCRREAVNFAPANIPVEIINNDKDILFVSEELNGLFQIEKEFIMAVCSDDLENTKFEIFKKKDRITSGSIRDDILAYFRLNNKIFEVGSDDLHLPVLLPPNEPISISHHLNLGALAYPKYLIE